MDGLKPNARRRLAVLSRKKATGEKYVKFEFNVVTRSFLVARCDTSSSPAIILGGGGRQVITNYDEI